MDNVTLCFLGVFQDFHFTFGFQQFYYYVPRWDFLCIYTAWESFIELPEYVNWLNLDHFWSLFFKYFISPILFLLFCNADYMYVCREALFTFVDHFSLYSLDWIIVLVYISKFTDFFPLLSSFCFNPIQCIFISDVIFFSFRIFVSFL